MHGLKAVILAGSAAAFVPTSVWAKIGPFDASFPWVMLGEGGVILLESALLMSFFGLGRLVALKLAVVVNLVSLLVGMLLNLQSMLPFALSETLYNPLLAPGEAQESVRGFFALLGVLTVLAVMVETPLYRGALLRHLDRRPALMRIVAINLISYPLFFTLIYFLTAAIQPTT